MDERLQRQLAVAWETAERTIARMEEIIKERDAEIAALKAAAAPPAPASDETEQPITLGSRMAARG